MVVPLILGIHQASNGRISAQSLRFVARGNTSVSVGQAKAVMLCLDRMTWNEVTLRDAKQEELANILARVEICLG